MAFATRTTISLARFATQRIAISQRVVAPAASSRWMTSNITYSGGQAFEGQGGFYSSGGHRASAGDRDHQQDGREFMLAVASDVQAIEHVMDEVDRLESLLESEDSGAVTNKSMELKNAIKKAVTAPDFVEALKRLEVEGAPVWGLSTAEREMIVLAKEKMNNC
eukprot:CAMPEP_0198154822 /NCGR_PEP_ID=MMETSP1443-20131203/68806_1 /TAXON_ID=186043 /ORGANISM="Entomoneis sp., Strain CCMP2396" /LENGTH=163 /DNA_ID=CAMNT_0043821537 /DNA_START=32 /DNA_END=523 /DNA_ORIENTATION=+